MDNWIIDKNIPETVDFLEQYKYSNKIFTKKFFKQFFVVLLTNLTTLLLLTVDGVVVSQFVGEKALNSVNLLQPFTLIIGAVTALVAGGVGIVIAKAFGAGSEDRIQRFYKASSILTMTFVVGITIIQIPLVYMVIHFYTVDSELRQMMILYAVGLIIANSVSVINTVGSYMLLAAGKVKELLRLSILESTLNLALDLLFVWGFKMGVLGAGLATAISCTVRSIATIILTQKVLKIFPLEKLYCKREIKEILFNGFPSMSTMLMISLSGYLMSMMITRFVGLEAVTVLSVCVFVKSFLQMVTNSFVQAGSGMLGILIGVEDWEVAKDLEKKILSSCVITIAALVLILVAFPNVIFFLYGISKYSNFQLLSTRFVLLSLIPFSIVSCLANLCVYCGKKKITVFASVLEAILLVPVFLLFLKTNQNLVFLCYAICSLVSASILAITGIKTMKEKINEDQECSRIHFSFKSQEAVEVSKKLYESLKNSGMSDKFVYRLSLISEELGFFAISGKNEKIVDIFISLKMEKDFLLVFYLDNGVPAILNKKLKATNLILGNYNLVESMASEFSYHNVIGMNNFVIRFNV